MRKSAVVLALVLFAVFASAGEAEVNSFVNSCLQGNETFMKEGFAFEGAPHYLVAIEGKRAMVVADEETPRALAGKEEIEGALFAYYAERGETFEKLLPSEGELGEIDSHVLSFNQSRGAEHMCISYIGMDRFPCIDQESCWRACHTPVCQTLKVGMGKPFLDMLLDLSMGSKAIDGGLYSFERGMQEMREGRMNGESAGNANGALLEAEENAIEVERNPLFDPAGLGFCKSTQYNYTGLRRARERLNAIDERLADLFAVEEVAEEMEAETEMRLALREERISALPTPEASPISETGEREETEQEEMVRATGGYAKWNLIALAGWVAMVAAVMVVALVLFSRIRGGGRRDFGPSPGYGRKHI